MQFIFMPWSLSFHPYQHNIQLQAYLWLYTKSSSKVQLQSNFFIFVSPSYHIQSSHLVSYFELLLYSHIGATSIYLQLELNVD